MKAGGQTVSEASMTELDRAWTEAKAREGEGRDAGTRR